MNYTQEEQMKKYLHAIFHQGITDKEAIVMVPHAKKDSVRYQKPRWMSDISSAMDTAGRLAEEHNIYVGWSPRQASKQEKESGNSGGKADVSRVPCLGFDFDYGQDGHAVKTHPDRDILLERLRTLPLPLSVLVDSGGGFHGYLVLKEYVAPKIGEKLLARVKAWLLAHGFKVENADHVAAILRVPGTLNHKQWADDEGDSVIRPHTHQANRL